MDKGLSYCVRPLFQAQLSVEKEEKTKNYVVDDLKGYNTYLELTRVSKFRVLEDKIAVNV